MTGPDSAPSAAVAFAEPERQTAELAAMRRMIEASHECFSLSIAICNSPALRDYLVEEIRRSFAGLRVAAIPRGTVDVYGYVAAEVPQTPSVGLFVTGLEGSIPSDAEGQPALRSLNASRELWEQRYPCPVIFWLPEYAATLLAREAPDFWRYRSHRFEFVSEQAGAMEGLADRFAGNITAAGLLSADEKRFRIAELEQRIAELGDTPPKNLALHTAVWLGELGFLYQFIGDLDRAEEMHHKSLAISEKLGHLEGMAADYGNLGLVYKARGDLDRAEEMHRKSLAIEDKLGHLEGMAATYSNLGGVYEKRGDLHRAEEMCHKSLAIEEKLGHVEGMAATYSNLGVVYMRRGDLDRAEEMYHKSLAIEEKLGHLEAMASDYGNLGGVYITRGDLDQAEKMLRRALEINEKLGHLEGMAGDYGNLGVIYKERGDLDRARDLLTHARDLFTQIGTPEEVRRTQNLLNAIQREEVVHHRASGPDVHD